MTDDPSNFLARTTEEIWSAKQEDPSRAVFGLKLAPLILCLMVIALLCVGIAMIHSATIATKGDFFFRHQLIWIGIGLCMFLFAAFAPLRVLYRWSHWGILLIMLPLAYLAFAKLMTSFGGLGVLRFFPFISQTKGAIRWLQFGSVKIQPSEFSKLFLVLYLAAYYGRLPREQIRRFVPGVLIPGAVAGGILALIFLGKDLSTTVITGGMAFVMMFLAGIRFRWIVLFGVLGVAVVYAFIQFSPMRVNRMLAYRDPKVYRDEESHQLWRSQLCLGSGGMTGVGYANGVMKTYLQESHTDFIVAVLGEEFGMVGIFGVIGAYLLICLSIVAIALQCRQRSDLLLCLGIAMLLALQAMVNVGVVSGWCPPTGVTAPFLSYGGSSIISLMFLIGLVLNVNLRNRAAVSREISSQCCLPTPSAMELLHREETPRRETR
ncbi:MAG: cell division protein FtsW [Victivallales bacterium]|nr:cell division protein FtsW [Victivallales bacterium]